MLGTRPYICYAVIVMQCHTIEQHWVNFKCVN